LWNCKCEDYSMCFSSYVLEKFTIFVTKCEKSNPKLFFLCNKATNTFCIDHEKIGIVPKCVFRTDILQTKFTTSGGCNISSTYLPCLCTPWVSSHQLVLLYLLLRKQSREDKNILWMMRMIFERHPCCCGTRSMSSNAMECVRV
jgi:hypothetical protein